MKTTVSALSLAWLALAACQPAGEQGEETAPAPGQQEQQPERQPTQEQPATGAGEGAPGATAPGQAPAGVAAETAEAEILATEGQDTGGVIRFTRAGGEVRIQGTITGLTPGEHGFHIHAKGDCSAPDATSAGDHFNPDGHPHGAPTDPPDRHHRGDFGNITADGNGEAEVNLSDPELTMSGPDSIIGKAVIVHAQRDDLTSQPSGNAGARVGCGVIRPVDVSGPTSAR
jgi:Cu-Zn family superoxide dismutase